MVIRKGCRSASIIALWFSLLLNTPLAFGWNAVGHGVVATIAYEQLSPAEKQQLQAWIKPLHHYYPVIHDVSTLAVWPDWLKREGIKAFNRWHYVNRPYGLHHYPIQDTITPSVPNVIWAIEHSENVLVSEKSNPMMKSAFLGFLLHCVGDIHQPFHAINGYSTNHPQGDRGASDYLVRTKSHTLRSLHSVWDGGLGLFRRDLDKPMSQQVKNLAHILVKRYPPSYFKQKIKIEDPSIWARESYTVAVNVGYGVEEGGDLSEAYIASAQQVVMEQVTLAGYRLAQLLKKIIKVK